MARFKCTALVIIHCTNTAPLLLHMVVCRYANQTFREPIWISLHFHHSSSRLTIHGSCYVSISIAVNVSM